MPPIPLIAQQPHHFQKTNPPWPTLLSTQSIPNPNNKSTQALNNIELQTLPSYIISTAPVHEIQLRSGRVVNDKPNSLVIIREEDEEEEDPNEFMNEIILKNVDISKIPVHTHPQQEPTQEQRIPPFLEWLSIEKPIIHPEYDIFKWTKKCLCQDSSITIY